MRPGESYRLKSGILGVTPEGPPRTTVAIPQRSIVTIVDDPINVGAIRDVIWNGKTLIIFAQDLRERGELVDGKNGLSGHTLYLTT